MADTLSALLGLQQQEAARTNPFLDPNTIVNGLQQGVKSSRERELLDLQKAKFGLEQQVQAFDQNYKTQVLDMKRKEFQNEQELNDMLFPVGDKMLKYQQAKAISALDLQSAQIDREEALTMQSWENQNKISASRQNADNFLTTRLNAYSDEDLINGRALTEATSIPGLTHEDYLRVTQAVKAAEAQQHVHNMKLEQANLELLQGQANIDKNKAALDKYLVPFNDLSDEQKQEITQELVDRKKLETTGRASLLKDLSNPTMHRSIKTDAKGGISYSVSPSSAATGKFLGMTVNQQKERIEKMITNTNFQAKYSGLDYDQQRKKAREILENEDKETPESSTDTAPVDSFFNSVGIQ